MTERFTTPPIDVGKGFAVEFSFADGRMEAAWSPRLPWGRHARAILPAYRVARHRFLNEVAEKLGILIAVSDEAPEEVRHG